MIAPPWSSEMITSLTIESFKAHRSTTIGLERLTVLVGPNGTGKTSILQALRCMSQLVVRPAHVVFSNDSEPSLLRRKGSTGPVLVTTEGIFAERGGRTSFELTVTEPNASGERGWGDSSRVAHPRWLRRRGLRQRPHARRRRTRPFLDVARVSQRVSNRPVEGRRSIVY